MCELEILLHDQNIDILCLAEHWFQSDEKNTFNFNNYTIGGIYCRTHFLHGDVSIYIKTHLRHKIVCLDKFCSEKNIELSAIELIESNILIIVFYRSPLEDINIFFVKLQEALDFLCKRAKSIMLIGDCNIDFLSQNESKTILLDIVLAFNLSVIVNEPTRYTTTSFACIDNILVDHSQVNCYVNVIDPCLSDHCGIQIDVPVNENLKNSPLNYNVEIKHRPITDQKLFDFLKEIKCTDFSKVYTQTDVESSFNVFHDIILYCFKRNFKEITIAPNKKNQLLNQSGIQANSKILREY